MRHVLTSVVLAVTWFLAPILLVGCANSNHLHFPRVAELQANDLRNTYRVINEVLAPNGNVVQGPDCAHREFGRHIKQDFDHILDRYVFEFHIHRDQDNDRCIKFDRQRNEIKVYDKSPGWLKGTKGSAFTYVWEFKLDKSFQASRRWTHLHQIKAFGGSEADKPVITLGARKGDEGVSDTFYLQYAEHEERVRVLGSVNLQSVLGQWIEVTEHIFYGENGRYSVSIKSIETNEVIYSYSNNAIRMWRNGARFLRPHWGIYRGLGDKDNLRDEIVRFSDIRISRISVNN